MKPTRFLTPFALAGALLLMAGFRANAATTTLVSRASDGTIGNNASATPSLSADGRTLVFTSTATNLVAGDTNGVGDVFVRNLQTGVTTLVSRATDGTLGNGLSDAPKISADGRFVVFKSAATNLVSDDTNGKVDIFAHDLQTGTTSRVSLANNGTQANSRSDNPVLSADGRYVAFEATASNLVTDDTNNQLDVFVRDTQANTTTLVSRDSSGTIGNLYSQKPGISADGRYVVFESGSSNLVAGDTNNGPDIFLHDTQTGATTRISLTSAGAQANSGSFQPSISADGRIVGFTSLASNLVAGDTANSFDAFVRDLQSGTTTLVSQSSAGVIGNGNSGFGALSADGRYAAFVSQATNLVAGDANNSSDTFIRDLQANTTTLVSRASDGTAGNSDSYLPSLSADGRIVAFESQASNFAADDTNGAQDIFVRDSSQLPTVSVGNVSQIERNVPNSLGFTVSLSSVSDQPVTVNYATADGTATAGSDYTAKSGKLTIPAGQISGTISIAIKGDTVVEPDETFFLNLSNAVGATLTTNQATGTLLNDDTNNRAPKGDSVTPSNSIAQVGQAFTLTAVYSDPDGAGDISEARLLIGAGINGRTNSLYALYDAKANLVYLYNDSTTLKLGGFTPGSNNTISNSQGTLNVAQTTVSASGNTLTVNFNFTPNASYVGQRDIYTQVVDTAGARENFKLQGSVNITVPAPPALTGLTPQNTTSPVGVAQSFTQTYSDPNGANDIVQTRFLVNATQNKVNALYGVYNAQTNKLYLYDNAGNVLLGGFTPGSANTISNSQGTLNVADTTVARNGNQLTINWNFTPSASFAGAKKIYGYVRDTTNRIDGLRQTGTWNITAPTAAPKANPSAGKS